MDRTALFRIIFDETKYMSVKFYQFSCIQNTINWIAFENEYESSIIFQPFLYANVPADPPSYAPTFFYNFRKKKQKVYNFDRL